MFFYQNILVAPKVRLEIIPSNRVKEEDRLTLTLKCVLEEGTPPYLVGVRFHREGEEDLDMNLCDDEDDDDDDGTVIETRKYCYSGNETMSIFNTTREDAGHYSCTGKNLAGWGTISDPEELVVMCKLIQYNISNK